MFFGSVSLVSGKAVFGVEAVPFRHLPVPRYFGDDAGGGDGIAQGVAVDDAALFPLEPQALQRVDQEQLRRDLLRRPAHGVLRSVQDVDLVDLLRGSFPDADVQGRFLNLLKDLLAPLFGQLLAVVHVQKEGLPGHHDAGGHHVAHQRPAARLVHPGKDDAALPQGKVRLNQLIQAFLTAAPHGSPPSAQRAPALFPG